MLQHFTGAKAHNVALRESAVRRGLHVSEYGILDDATGETLRCATEEEVYERARAATGSRPSCARAAVSSRRRADGGGLPDADRARRPARRPALPHDALGRHGRPLEEMAEAAQERGYEYLAITDHSASHGFGDHVTPDALRGADRARSAALNEQLDGFELLIGTETNILPDGSLDYPDELLARARLGDRLRPHLVRAWASTR